MTLTAARPEHPTPSAERLSAGDWLVRRRNDGATPDVICAELIANGWHADVASKAALSALTTTDRHRWLYVALCWSAGLAALGAASAAHIALSDESDPLALASCITLALVAAPIGLIADRWARRVEADEPHAIWSPTRRVLFATLASATAAVGIIRLLVYTFGAVAAAVGARGYEFTPAAFIQVAVTLSVAMPLFAWSLAEWRKSNVVIRVLRRTADRGAGAPRPTD